MRPPFSYYGGKQRLASKIVSLIPRHTVYVEPFAGSCAVLFAKPWPLVSNSHHYREVVNDTNSDIVNFFRQLRDNPVELHRLCSLSPYSKEEYELAKASDSSSDIEKARVFFILVSQSFAGKLGRGWKRACANENHPVTFFRKASNLLQLADRLASVYIDNLDAIELINRWDSPQTLFYCDPPYPATDQGHYAGFSDDQFRQVVDTLNRCDGSFVLSCYGFDAPKHWERFDFKAYCSASGQGKVGPGRDKSKAAKNTGNRDRTEVVYRVIRGQNVRPEIRKLYQLGLFDCFEGGGPEAEEAQEPARIPPGPALRRDG